MPRYLVERVFPTGFPEVAPDDDTDTGRLIAAINSELGVVWITSFVSDDRRRSFCVCEAPSPEAIRRAAGRYQWPVDAITRVSALTSHAAHDGARDSIRPARPLPTTKKGPE